MGYDFVVDNSQRRDFSSIGIPKQKLLKTILDSLVTDSLHVALECCDFVEKL